MAKSSSLDIGVEEWLSELESLTEIGGDTEGAFSSEDLQRMTGKGRWWVMKKLRETYKAGRLEVVMRIEKNILGREKGVPTYRLKKKGKKDG